MADRPCLTDAPRLVLLDACRAAAGEPRAALLLPGARYPTAFLNYQIMDHGECAWLYRPVPRRSVKAAS
jgi:hypothetical protein